MNAVITFLLMAFWMLREIEGAWAERRHVKLDTLNRTATWRLPVSKTDPKALGCERTWGCTCGNSPTWTQPRRCCPYHIMEAHLTALDLEFGEDLTLPLLPTALGGVVAKAAMVASFECVAVLLEIPLTTPEGRRYLGGHSARVSGARYWVRIGVEIYKVQLLARWKSSIVLRYVQEAPLQSITGDVVELQKGRLDVLADLECIRKDVVALRQAMCEMDPLTRAHATEHLAVLDASDPTARPAEGSVEQYVLNTSSGVYHRIAIFDATRKELCRTICGWKFYASPHSLVASAPSQAICCCDKCFSKHGQEPRTCSTSSGD